jgi:L,D-transpeptidase YbiS
MPLNETIKFDLIGQSQRIFKERKRLKEIDEMLSKLNQNIELKEKELEAIQIATEIKNGPAFYAVVDLFNNILLLKKEDRIITEFKISSGTGDTLIAPWGKKWIFETPKGVLRILRKIKDPIWYKPDWAFLEAKESIPSSKSPRRFVRGILGDYALDLGGGIMLHGTPYEQFLGQSVSHGCIRLPKEGISNLYDSLALGAKVYIFGK